MIQQIAVPHLGKKNILYIKVLLVVTSCCVVVGHQHFTGPCCLYLQGEHPEDGGSMDLWNADTLPQHYTAS